MPSHVNLQTTLLVSQDQLAEPAVCAAKIPGCRREATVLTAAEVVAAVVQERAQVRLQPRVLLTGDY